VKGERRWIPMILQKNNFFTTKIKQPNLKEWSNIRITLVC